MFVYDVFPRDKNSLDERLNFAAKPILISLEIKKMQLVS
jgi:hypothetical protein